MMESMAAKRKRELGMQDGIQDVLGHILPPGTLAAACSIEVRLLAFI